MKVLIRDAPKENLTEILWDEGAKRRYHFSNDEVSRLDSGQSIWRGETCFMLETRMEVEEDDIL